MRAAYVCLALLAGALLLSLAACSGSSTESNTALGSPAPEAVQAGSGLPDLNSLPRDASLVSNDTANGSAYIDAANQANSGTAAVLDSPGPGAGDMAYTIYSIPERPGEQPVMVQANGLFYDPTPAVQDTDEGIWLAWGDWSSGDGVWRFAGPFNQYSARHNLPTGPNYVNGSGNIIVAVLVVDGGRYKCGNVQVGYDIGLDYEQYRLAAPRGSATGRLPQIQVDENDHPQVAYLDSAINFGGEANYSMKIASHDGGQWNIEQVPTGFSFDDQYFFALGDSGRRALLVKDSGPNDWHLLFDDGSGTFNDAMTVLAADTGNTLPTLAFINGADDPLGELDTVLVVYADNYGFDDCDLNYVRYDGVNPPVSGMFLAGTVKPGKLNLMVEENQATLAIPTEPVVDQYNASFHEYSGVADSWAASPIADWVDIDIENDYEHFQVHLIPQGSGEYVCAYLSEDNGHIAWGRYSGGAWTSDYDERTVCMRPEPWLDIERFSDNTLVFPTYYSAFNLAIYEGNVGDGNPFTFHPFPAEDFTVFEMSAATDSTGTLHIAASDLDDSNLAYLTYEQGGTLSEPQAIDNGAGGFGMIYGPSMPVYVDGELHVFSADSAHLRILHSTNNNGVWTREMQPIVPFDRYCYIILKAGYLENTNQVYVAYMDILDMGMYVTYATPEAGAESWEWQTGLQVPIVLEIALAVEDDETNIGVVYYSMNPVVEESINFSLAPPGQIDPDPGIIGYNLSQFTPPWSLRYNGFDPGWYLMSRDDNERQAYLWQRAGQNDWRGPHTVAKREAAADQVIGADLEFDPSTGRARAVVYEKDDGCGCEYINVYAQANDEFDFSPPIEVKMTTIGTHDMAFAYATLDNSGAPFIGVLTKPIADDEYDVEFFEYDGIGNWTLADTWDSPLWGGGFNLLYDAVVMTPAGDHIGVFTDMSISSPSFGRTWVYYPW